MAAADGNEYFGFELLNRLVDPNLVKKEDIIVLFVHWFLVKNGFKCLGLGDSKVYNPANDRGTDFLPTEWNRGPNYTLRYAKSGKLYILVGIKSDANLLINLLKAIDNGTSIVELPIEETIASIHGPLEKLMPTHGAVLSKIRAELVEPLSDDAAREISTQTSSSGAETRSSPTERRRGLDDDPLRVGSGPLGTSRQPRNPLADPRNIGRSDLDPFSRGDGMIFDPFTPYRGIPGRPPGGLGIPGRLPPGAVPPGARFDPFGPPEIGGGGGRRRFPQNPDADHLPPPGYDDMFM